MDTNSDIQSNIVLSLYHKNGILAVAYYNIDNNLLYSYQEIIDLAPQYAITRSVLRELQPNHVISIGGIGDSFIKTLMTIIREGSDDSTSTMGIRKPANFSILPSKEFSFHACEYNTKVLRLLSEPPDLTPEERVMYLRSFIDLSSSPIIYSLGSLIKFTQCSWQYLKPLGHNEDDKSPVYAHIRQLTLNDRVCIDSLSFKSLQIFQRTNHDSNFKHGSCSSSREGTSLFRILCQYTVTSLGYLAVRNLLLNPIRNVEELQSRLDFIEFTNNIRNTTLVGNIGEHLKKISDVNIILQKIYNSKASAEQWNTLNKTLFNVLCINELCTVYAKKCALFDSLMKSIGSSLYEIYDVINETMDFTSKRSRPTVKEGIDSELDEVKRRNADIKNRLTAAQRTVAKELPNYLRKCVVLYVPEMGHVLSIRKWDEFADPNELAVFGYHLFFEIDDEFYYKNALCKEMDIQLGDLPNEIIKHENRVIERVAAFVLRENDTIRKSLEIVAMIDALISISKVSKDRGYVRPKYNMENVHEIEDGRHPMMEVSDKTYVPNSFHSGGRYSHMKIITGPNSSGKSVYLKQVAILVYLGHVGCFIPAKSANIAMVHSIHARMQARESASLNLSAFMNDVSQMSQALYNAKSNSLILLDEFGRGTTGRESKALLLGILRKFLAEQQSCPHIVVSTHMQLEKTFLNSPLVLYQKLLHDRIESNEIVFLYKVADGETSSFAFDIAAQCFVDKILNRARQISDNINKREEKPREVSPGSNNVVIGSISIEIPPLDE